MHKGVTRETESLKETRNNNSDGRDGLVETAKCDLRVPVEADKKKKIRQVSHRGWGRQGGKSVLLRSVLLHKIISS